MMKSIKYVAKQTDEVGTKGSLISKFSCKGNISYFMILRASDPRIGGLSCSQGGTPKIYMLFLLMSISKVSRFQDISKDAQYLSFLLQIQCPSSADVPALSGKKEKMSFSTVSVTSKE